MEVLAETAENFNSTETKFVAEAQRGADDLRDMISTLSTSVASRPVKCRFDCKPTMSRRIARKAATRFSPVLKNRTLRCDVPPRPRS